VVLTALAGALAGALVGYLPGISAAIAAVAVLFVLPGDLTDRGYVIATSGVDTANAIFALFALVSFGEPRTGVLVAVETVGVPLNLPVLVCAVLFAGLAGTVAVVVLGDPYFRLVASVEYLWLSIGVLCLLLLLSGLFAGLAGIGVFVLATAVGLVPVRFGAYRVHCMGVLLCPILLSA
jgi:putative membrane protein